MTNNTPITDAELAEVKRLYAAATPGEWRMFYGGEPLLIGVSGELVADMEYPRDAEAVIALHNAFGPLIARLEAAERYRDNLEVELEEARDNANEFENDCRFALTTLASRMGYEWDGDGATADSLLEHVWQTVEEASKELQGWRHEREMTLTAFAHVRGGGDPALIGHPNGSVFGDALRGMLAARLEAAEREQDELRDESAYIKQQLEWVEENSDTYQKSALVDFIRRTIHCLSHTAAIKEALAARDAQQRREGAVMKLLDMSLGDLAWDGTDLRHEAESMIGDEKQYQTMLAEAKRLRERGE